MELLILLDILTGGKFMGIIRVRKNKQNPYVIFDKSFIEDPGISLQATAILAYLLSKPDDWRVYEDDIVNHFTNGKRAIRSAIKELIERKYMVRSQKRTKSGKFDGYDYDIYERPRVGVTVKEKIRYYTDRMYRESLDAA